MVRRAIVLACLAALAAPAQAAPDQRTQVDEFAIGAGPDRPGIEQIAPGGDPVATPPQAHDRQVAIDQEQAPVRGADFPALQLRRRSRAGTGRAAGCARCAGFVGVEQRRQPPAIRSADQGSGPLRSAARPGEARRMPPHPRTPRRGVSRSHRARPERRTAAPRRAGQPRVRRRRASPDSLRLRIASHGDPDADARSNQELASIYLAGDQTPPSEPAQPTEPEATANLAEVLRGIIVDMQANGGGSQ